MRAISITMDSIFPLKVLLINESYLYIYVIFMKAISITIDSKVPLRVLIINKRKDTHHKYQ